MSLGSIIRDRREGLGLTQDQAALRVDISKPYLSNIETGRVTNPPSDKVLDRLEQALELAPGTLKTLAHELRTPPDVRVMIDALRGELERLRALLKDVSEGKAKPEGVARRLRKIGSEPYSCDKPIPVVNKAVGGYPPRFDPEDPSSPADESIRLSDVHDPRAFAVRVADDAMEPRYCRGDLVVLAPGTGYRSGDDCLVRFRKDRSTSFARVQQARGERVRLEPLNPKYPAQEYLPDELDGIWPAVFRIERLR